MRNEKKISFLMVWMPAGKPLDSYLILGNKSIYSPKVINSVTKWGNDIKMIIFVHFNNLVTELNCMNEVCVHHGPVVHRSSYE